MPIAAIELVQTEKFISHDPSVVVVQRRAKVATAAGGYTLGAPVAQAAQTIRLVEMIRMQAKDQRMTADGQTVTPTHVAITLPDGNFQIHDKFDANGFEWEVLWISKKPKWRWQLELIGRA